jgi:hypothetical protein
MNRTLRRPMFRMGGSAGEGITSGLAPRQGYNKGLSVKPENFPGNDAEWQAQQQRLIDLGILDAQGNRVGGPKKQSLGSGQPGGTFVGGGTGSTIGSGGAQSKWAERMKILDTMYPRQKTDSMAGANFLMNWGVDLASRPRSGNIFQQAATSGKEPLLRFQEEKLMEQAAAAKETSEDRALLAKMLEGMDDDKLSALMKDVKAGVLAGEFPDEKTGIKLLLQKKIYGVLPMEGEVYEDNIKDIEKQLQREDIPTLMLRSVAEHIYKANNNLYPPEVQADLDKVRGYVKPMHIVGDSRDEDGEIIEFVVDSKFDRTYRPNKIYFDPETGNLFKRVGKRGEAIIFKKVIFEE